MEKNRLDPLENLFKSRMSEDLPAANGWNVAPDSVIQNVMDDLDKKRKKNRAFFILILLAIMIPSSIAYYLVNHSMKINELNHIIDELQKSKEIIVESNIGETKKNTNPLIDEEDSDGIQDGRFVNTIPKKAKPSFSNPISQKTKVVKLDNDQKISTSSINQNKSRKLKTEILKNSGSTRNITAVDNIPILTISTVSTEPEMPTSNINAFQQNPSPSKKVNVFAFAGPVFSSFSMSNIGTNDFSLNNYDQSILGYHAGLGLTYKLSDKLRINSYSAFNRINNKSKYSDQLSYKKENEKMSSQGVPVYSANLNIESPLGSFGSSNEFSVANLNISEDASLDHTTDISQKIDILSLAVGLDLDIYTNNHFDVYISGGINNNFVLSLKQDMNSKIFYSEQMMMDKTHSQGTLNHLQNYFLSAQSGLGINFHLNPTISLGLSGTYSRSLTSVRKKNLASSPNTFIKSFSSGVLLKYNF